ncbi:gamma-glutamyltranspeptidase [Zopfochytrium polystomum]|nr:gamma-glutamyltranspeptidase [Zopfochytrium polystomum]
MTTSFTPDPLFPFATRRSAVYATHGMVASTQPLATEAGLRILKAGGNAADAAVAVAAALNVTEPGCTGIGGDLFCLYFDAATKTVKGLNGSGRAPAALTLDSLRKAGISGRSIPSKNANAVTVPGAAAGWVDTIELFGSKKLTMAEILEPAIQLAENGYPVAPISAYMWQRSEKMLQTASPNGGEMLKDGRAPNVGEIIRLPTLAQTFRAVASEGRAGFYKGRIAEAIVEVISSLGGRMTLEDLASHTSTPVTPISITYEGVTVHECPPNGQGITALMALGILEALQEKGITEKLGKLEHNGVDYLHAIIEALRVAFADTRYFVADPAVVDVPVEGMLSKSYLADRASTLISAEKASSNIIHGSPANSSDTVYFSVVDAAGNACSFIISNYEGFGTCVIPKGCGFTLQNRGSNFTLEEGHPNCIAPGKRPYHTIIPAMATKNGNLYMSYGVMGGFMQPQGHVQVLLNVHAFGFDPQSALDAPRVCLAPSPGDDKDDTANGIVYVEDGIREEVVAGLRAKGHRVVVVKGAARGVFGRGQIVLVREDTDSPTGRVLAAGSDGRGDGLAFGY